MTNYVFESMTQAQAAAFTTADSLFFVSTQAANIVATDTAQTALTQESITLSAGSISLTFAAASLNAAATTAGHLTFINGDALGLGTSMDNTVTALNAQKGAGAAIWGFAGNDTLNATIANDTVAGGDGNDSISGASGGNDGATPPNYTENDYYQGGAGADTIQGGIGNDHIYGNALSTVQGSVDGADSLNGGAGNDYIQGNAGNDTIDGGTGNDRLFGGADNDTLYGNAGNDSANGNLGNDLVIGGAGNDTLRGGQGDDTIWGDESTAGSTVAGNDMLYGDLGNDSLYGGQGHDTLTGGAGADTFGFGTVNLNAGTTLAASYSSDAAFTTGTAAGTYVGDEITDFTHGTDKIAIAFATGSGGASAIDFAQNGASFTTVSAALTYAQQLLDTDTSHGGHEVAAIQVGSDTYLFYVSSGTDGGQIDSLIKLDGVTASTLTTSDFI